MIKMSGGNARRYSIELHHVTELRPMALLFFRKK